MITIKGTCDQCGKVFDVKFRHKKHPIKIEETYFRCPHCKHKYTAYYASDETRNLQRKMRKLHRDVFEKSECIDMKAFYQQEQELKNKIKLSMDEARRIVEGR